MTAEHFCYALQCDHGRVRSYVGYTTDPVRRLRQHNGEIKGGARRTTRAIAQHGDRGCRWRFLFVVQVVASSTSSAGQPSWDSHRALSLEWHLKGVRTRRWRRPDGGGAAATTTNRVQLLARALALPKFRPFLADAVVWARDDCCDEVWVALDEMHDALGLRPLDGACVLPLSDAPFLESRLARGRGRVY
jgi:hypothetical protein